MSLALERSPRELLGGRERALVGAAEKPTSDETMLVRRIERQEASTPRRIEVIRFRWEMRRGEVMESVHLGPERRPWPKSNAVRENCIVWPGRRCEALERRVCGQ